MTATVVSDPARIRENLVTQMFGAVRWTESVRFLAAQGVTDVVECGPGKVLSGLIKRIDKNLNTDQIGSAQAERLIGQRS